MSKVDGLAHQPIPVNPGSVVAGDTLLLSATVAQGNYKDHVTVNLDEFSSGAAVSGDASTEVSETSMVDVDLESDDGRDPIMQSLMEVPVRVRDVAPPPSPRLDALQRHMDSCIESNRTSSRDIQAVLGFSAAVAGAGLIGLTRLAQSPYTSIIGGAGVSVFMAGVAMVRYAGD